MAKYEMLHNRVLRRKQPTIKQFIDKHKVVLDVILCHFSKIRLHDGHHLSQELKDESCIDILFGGDRQPDVGPFDVKETRPSNVGDWRTNLLPRMDHVHSERIHRIPPTQHTFTPAKLGYNYISHIHLMCISGCWSYICLCCIITIVPHHYTMKYFVTGIITVWSELCTCST